MWGSWNTQELGASTILFFNNYIFKRVITNMCRSFLDKPSLMLLTNLKMHLCSLYTRSTEQIHSWHFCFSKSIKSQKKKGVFSKKKKIYIHIRFTPSLFSNFNKCTGNLRETFHHLVCYKCHNNSYPFLNSFLCGRIHLLNKGPNGFECSAFKYGNLESEMAKFAKFSKVFRSTESSTS